MTLIFILLPLSLLLGTCGMAAYIWSVRSGQYDDLDGSAQRATLADPEELKNK